MMSAKFGLGAAKWLGCGALACGLGAFACSSNQPPPAHPSTVEASSPDARHDMAAGGDHDTTIRISDDFRKQCQLPVAPDEAPHFDYDDSTLHARGANILDDVAKCMSTGPLKGQTITIIGRTDPRGSDDHNERLSANRAEAARNYLVQRGVLASTVRIVARGAQNARGTDEQTWALDRRVDFELGDPNVAGSPAANNLNASPSPIMEGTRLNAASPGNASKTDAASYADTAEGGKEAGASSGKSGGSASASGSASGSAHAGTGK